jgi:hypothetical protein
MLIDLTVILAPTYAKCSPIKSAKSLTPFFKDTRARLRLVYHTNTPHGPASTNLGVPTTLPSGVMGNVVCFVRLMRLNACAKDVVQ